MYPYLFRHPGPFIQRVALDMVRYGFRYYCVGHLPAGADAEAVDRKILSKYDIAVSRFTRARRKAKGLSNVHYARLRDTFVMLASKGEHRWFSEERGIKDLGRDSEPLVLFGYSISLKASTYTGRTHVSVRVHAPEYHALREYYLSLAVSASTEELAGELAALPFEPYALVRKQAHRILEAVNTKRRRAGLERVPAFVLPRKRRVYRIFGEEVT